MWPKNVAPTKVSAHTFISFRFEVELDLGLLTWLPIKGQTLEVPSYKI